MFQRGDLLFVGQLELKEFVAQVVRLFVFIGFRQFLFQGGDAAFRVVQVGQGIGRQSGGLQRIALVEALPQEARFPLFRPLKGLPEVGPVVGFPIEFEGQSDRLFEDRSRFR